MEQLECFIPQVFTEGLLRVPGTQGTAVSRADQTSWPSGLPTQCLALGRVAHLGTVCCLVLHGCDCCHGDFYHSNFRFLEILSIIPVVTGSVLVPGPGLSQEQALSSFFNSTPSMNVQVPLPSLSCSAGHDILLSQLPLALSPSGAGALGRDCHYGHNQEELVWFCRPVGALGLHACPKSVPQRARPTCVGPAP